MTKAQQRIAIAKDVIKQLDRKKYTATKGVYVALKSTDILESPEFSKIDAKEFYSNKKCSVCAKGALLLSTIDRYNKIKLKDISHHWSEIIISDDGDDMDPAMKWLTKYFSRKQLNMIELAFELKTTDHYSTKLIYSKVGQQCINFGKQYNSARKRLRAIMNNVIENNGIFKP